VDARRFPDSRRPLSGKQREQGNVASNMTSRASRIDPRRQRTRDELLAAFFNLVLSRRYYEIRIADVLAISGVARSTFYEHFASKDELLAASLEGPFKVLAGMIDASSSVQQVEGLLKHFWDNRSLARNLFQGATHRAIRHRLICCIELRLAERAWQLRIPQRLVATAVADGMLSPIVAWLFGEAQCEADQLGEALRQSAAAACEAFRGAKLSQSPRAVAASREPRKSSGR
jgi:AcrR family transcriptional regulator